MSTRLAEGGDTHKPDNYAAYRVAEKAAAEHAIRTRTRCDAHLTPRLMGLEGKRVEVVHRDGTKRRFWVGKSLGWCPVHLEIGTRYASGGSPAYVPDDATVTVIR